MLATDTWRVAHWTPDTWRAAGERYNVSITADGCWIWRGTTDGRSTATMHTTEGCRSAARIIWEQLVGPLSGADQLAKICDTQLCVNPRHRVPRRRGAHPQRRRLNRLMASCAKAAIAGGMTYREVADGMNVSEATIRRVVRGEHWTEKADKP